MADIVNITYGRTGRSSAVNEMGMRPMQARVFAARAARFLLVKAPPASGKSRALMFLGLDKVLNQGLRKVIVAVPERSIGSSFASTDLKSNGFFADWQVEPRWNLCSPGSETGVIARSKVRSVADFLTDPARALVCTHATFRFAVDEIGTKAFDGCLVAIDEFHHVSASEDNRLGEIVRAFVTRDCAHLVAMTGSYFRGDAVPVLHPEDEARFTSVTYSYYEQLDGYEHLKSLGIGYSFYRDRYVAAIADVLDTDKKTIIHIPHVLSAEAYDHKDAQVGEILELMGESIGIDESTGFELVRRRSDGRVLKVADLVHDEPRARARVVSSLQAVRAREDLDIIIALGMAKEGFDWVWCEHALTIGYRNSLTEIVQIIGRATRDAPGKTHAQFTNLIAEPAADQAIVVDAVNDMLKAISGALLMENVLRPNFRFHPRRSGTEPEAWQDDEGTIHVTVTGLVAASTERARAIIENDMDDLIANACQRMSRETIADDVAPEVVTQHVLREVIERRYEDLSADETEAVRQNLAARLNAFHIVRRAQEEETRALSHAQARAHDTLGGELQAKSGVAGGSEDGDRGSDHLGLLRLIRTFINVRELDIDLIDSINPFRESYDVASKALDPALLSQIQAVMVARRIVMSEGEAVSLWPRIKRFHADERRAPNPNATDPLERRLGEALSYLRAKKAERMRAATAPLRPRSLDDVFADADSDDLLAMRPRLAAGMAGDQDEPVLLEEAQFKRLHGRAPDPQAADVVEAVLATKLARIRSEAKVSADAHPNDIVMDTALDLSTDLEADIEKGDDKNCVEAPEPARGALSWRDGDLDEEAPASLDELFASDAGLMDLDANVFALENITPAAEREQPEHRGERRPCKDYEGFKALFEAVHADVERGRRDLVPFRKDLGTETIEGDFFVERGLYAFVAEKSEKTLRSGRRDHRLRVVYSNGTESDVLMRSFERGLYNDPMARRVTRIGFGPLDPEWEEDRAAVTGTVYVARSLSPRPEIARDRSILHKIGVTSGSVTRRIAEAANDPTFLLAPVELVATYELRGMRRDRVEHILHHFFGQVRAGIIIRDRFGREVRPREWFYVSPDAVAQAIRAIADGSIVELEYNSHTQEITRREA